MGLNIRFRDPRWLHGPGDRRRVPKLAADIRYDVGCEDDVLEHCQEIGPMMFQSHYVLGQARARQGDKERAGYHLQRHREILDTRVKIHSLERRAGRNPRDAEVRRELVRLYTELDMSKHADFWRRAADAIGRE